MEVKNGSNEQKDLEEDARNALLAHFSSKSTNQIAILLGLALLVFADFQAYGVFNLSLMWQKITFLTFSLGTIAFFFTRQLSRLICWGQMADAVLIVEMKSKKETETHLRESAIKPDKVELDPTYLARLSFSSDCRFQDWQKYTEKLSGLKRLPLLIYRMTQDKHFVGKFIFAILAVWIVLLWAVYACEIIRILSSL
jgi:hypothetical protein